MEELGSMWSYPEKQSCSEYCQSVDELKQKLFDTTFELESFKMAAREEIRKNKENVRSLLNLLKMAYQERDEARNQLQKILNKLIPSSPTELPKLLPHAQDESPLVMPAKANSGITESNSLSETCNYHSHGSSPADSFFGDAVSSPDFSNINVVDSGFVNQPLVHKYNGCLSTGLVSSGKAKIDPATEVIDNLVKGKALPQKGKLLQAVMEAGPLLQTLIVAGPLPRWRNPPPLQPFKIPPVSIEGCQNPNVDFKSTATATLMALKPLNSSSYPVMSRGTSQTCSASILNFASSPSASCLNNSRLLTPTASINNHVPAGKRQRFL